MLELISYFEGHGGAVTCLTLAEDKQSFFSAGAEGLIVRWQLAKPNEGEAILKLPGLISAINFDTENQIIYATVNHKGLFVIDTKLRRILKIVELPGTSFNSIGLNANHIVLSTNFAELLIIGKQQLDVIHRLKTGLSSFSSFIINNTALWFASTKGVEQATLADLGKSNTLINEDATALLWQSDKLFFCSPKYVFSWGFAKNKLLAKISIADGVVIKNLSFDPQASTLWAFTNQKLIKTFKIEKKKIIPLNTMQIDYNGEINDILSIENYKFVITAGDNRKIGVWQLL